MINAARMYILMHWNTKHTPTLQKWFTQMNKVANIEELIQITLDRLKKILHDLTCWLHYKTIVEYKSIMLPLYRAMYQSFPGWVIAYLSQYPGLLTKTLFEEP